MFRSFAKQLETLFSNFRIFSVSRNDRNSAKQRPVSYSFVFRETRKKYETVNPNGHENYTWKEQHYLFGKTGNETSNWKHPTFRKTPIFRETTTWKKRTHTWKEKPIPGRENQFLEGKPLKPIPGRETPYLELLNPYKERENQYMEGYSKTLNMIGKLLKGGKPIPGKETSYQEAKTHTWKEKPIPGSKNPYLEGKTHTWKEKHISGRDKPLYLKSLCQLNDVNNICGAQPSL